jgi:YgiT-type zinc finger domain-containing protein
MPEIRADTCPYCSTPGTHPGIATLEVGRNGIEIRISGVPAYVCDACPEFMLPGPLSVEISDGIEHILSAIEAHAAMPTPA